MPARASRSEFHSRRNASLRRVAIVLQGLPSHVAEQLLGSLDPEASQRLRHELLTLADVDPLEQRRAMETFTGSLKLHAGREQLKAAVGTPMNQANTMPSGVSSSLSDGSRLGGLADTPAHDTAMDPLECVVRISDDELLRLLQQEHPQTQAVVLASIDPGRAAMLLPKFPESQRQDLMIRIGRLQSLPDEMIQEIAASFQSKIAQLPTSQSTASNPLQSLIDQYAPAGGWDTTQAANHVPAGAAAVSPKLQAILAEMPKPASPKQPTSVPPADQLASHAAQRLREMTQSDDDDSSDVSRLSTDEIHRELIGLSPYRLCQALGRVPVRIALLALCGLPNDVADAAISQLPRSQANQVRKQLIGVGAMEIREIDRAKQSVLSAARVHQPTVSGQHQPNASSRSAAAA